MSASRERSSARARSRWAVIAEETYEALVAGLGVVLLAAGNAPLVTLGGVVNRPVRGVSPTRFALAWRADDRRPLVREYVRACEAATHTG